MSRSLLARASSVARMVLTVLALASAAPARATTPSWPPTVAPSHPLDAYWSDAFVFPEFNASVGVVFSDSARVLLGGSFSGVGTVPARRVVAWDGVEFRALGDGLPGTVTSLARWGNFVVAGLEQPYGLEGGCLPDVWLWDGATWSSIGCFPLSVTSMAVWRGRIVANGTSYSRGLLGWNGSRWDTVATTVPFYTYLLLAVGDSLYAADSYSGSAVRVWTGSSWGTAGGTLGTTLGGSARVNSMIVWNGRPVIAGTHNTENGAARGSTVLQFDGTQWVGLGHAAGESNGLAIRNGELLASIKAGTEAIVYRLSAGEWVAVDPSAANSSPSRLATLGDAIVSASMSRLGATASSGPAFHAGGGWQQLRQAWGTNMHGVRAAPSSLFPIRLQPWSGDLLFGGTGRVGAGTQALAVPGGVARWNGSTWSALPAAGLYPQFPGKIRVDSAGALYGLRSRSIVRWDGATWVSASPDGPSDNLQDFTWYRGRMIACDCPLTYPVVTPGVEQLVDGAWKSIGGCVLTTPIGYECAWVVGTWNGQLVVGGDGSMELDCSGANTPWISGVALYDGTNWTLPVELDPAMPWMDAGEFVTWQGLLVVRDRASMSYPFFRAARPPMAWNGTRWQVLSEGAWEATSLASANGRLFAGGVFVRPDSSYAYGVAEWDGARWNLLGSGTDGPVTSLAVYEGDLYAAGAFGWANGKPASNITRLVGMPTVDTPGPARRVERVSLSAARPNPGRGVQQLAFTLPSEAHARLAVYDVTGRCVATLLDAPRDAGSHAITWDGRGANGARVAAGVYFARLRTAAGSASATLVRVE